MITTVWAATDTGLVSLADVVALTLHYTATGMAKAAVGFAVLAAILGLGLATWTVLSRHRTSRRAAAKTLRTQQQRWANGVTYLELTSELLMEFESDAEAVYSIRPLLADVAEPATAQFYTAYSKAQALRTESVPTDDAQITAFVTAAAQAARAFGLADENARRKGRRKTDAPGDVMVPFHL